MVKPYVSQTDTGANAIRVPASTGVLIDIIDRIKSKEKMQKAGESQFKGSATSDKIGQYMQSLSTGITATRRDPEQLPQDELSYGERH